MFSERRLAFALSAFMLSVFLLCVIEYKFIIAAAVVSGLFTAALIVLRFVFARKNKIKFKTLCGFALILTSAAMSAIFFCILHYNIFEKPVLKYLDEYKNTPVYIKAEIKDASSSNFMSKFDLKVYELNGEKIKKFNLSLTIFKEIKADSDEIDSILETWVVFKKLEDDFFAGSNIAYFKSGGYYIAADHASEIIVTVDEDGYEETEEIPLSYKITPVKSHSFTYHFASMRNYARSVFFKTVKFDYHDSKTPEAATIYGIFTGDKSYISSAIKTDFKKSGISHVLSVSGLHLSILCGIIFSFLNLCRVHKKTICVIIIICFLFFMAFTGFSMSVIRSGIMTILFYAAFLTGRKSDSMTSLFAAGTFIVLLNPYNILNIGFQLSFAATLGIVSTAEFNNKIISKFNEIKKFKFLIKPLKTITSSFIVTIAATVFTLPFICYSFKSLSLISPLTNLITSPLSTIILFLALCVIIFSFIPAITFIFSFPAYFMTKLMLIITRYLGSFKYAYISVESTGGTGFYIFAVIFLILIVLCFILPKIFAKKLVKPVLYASVILTFLIMCANLIYPRVIFKDSARFAYYSDYKNQNIIIFHKNYDCADIVDFTYGTQSHIKPVFDIITENGASHINSIILTHYHKRQAQMIRKYMNFSEINKVYIPVPADDYDIEVFNSLYYLSVNNFELIKYGVALKLDDILIKVDRFDYNKMRHMSVEIERKIENSQKKLLYLGIGYKEGYDKYTDTGEKSYDIIFYGTHKHNKRDDNYFSNLYGTYAGVISSYLNGNKNKTSQKLAADAVEAYLSGSLLFKSDDFNSIVFEIRKDGKIKHYLK